MKSLRSYSDCPQILRDFLFYMLTIRGRSPKTVDAYYIDLRTFLRFIKYHKVLNKLPENLSQVTIEDLTSQTICSITLSDVYEFLNYLQTDRSNEATTRSRKVSAIRSFYKYLTTKTSLLKENPVKDLEVPSIRKSMPKYLNLEESRRLLSVVDGKQKERDYCIITLLLNCGMRLSELVGINLENIRDNTVRLLGKGNKERIIYLNEACVRSLEDYLKVRKMPLKESERNALFLSSQGRRMSPRRVEQIVEENLKKAQLSGCGYSPHKLRHTAATLLYQHGNVDIRILKEILGHASLGTTEIYTHISDKQLEKAAAASPLAKETGSHKK